MFGLFKKKSEVEKLQEKYEKLMKEAYQLSTSIEKRVMIRPMKRMKY